MSKKEWEILVGLTVFTIVVIVAIRFFIGGPEDTWICENGGWVKHGSPYSSQPTSECK